MQLKVSPDNILEWIALQANLVPIPLLHAQIFPVVSKAVLEATDRGIFKAVANGHTTAEAVAQACSLHAGATQQLMGVLAAVGYFTFKEGHYTLTSITEKWILEESTSSLHGFMLFNNRIVWSWLEGMGEYLETGKGIDFHSSFGSEQWELYQSAMWSGAISEAEEFARRVPMPRGATRMLDIGGSHGLHSVAACRKYPKLSSTILDLPGAVEKAAPLLAKQGMGDRVVHRVGNVTTDELEKEAYDIVLMSSVAHHLTVEQNQTVAAKVQQALRPGGIFIINEFIRPDPSAKPELVGSSTDLFFGLTSASGNWSIEEIQSWYRSAGLSPYKVIGYRAIPGRYQVVGKKG
ncbi:class I SAM-dependent methyltransferase [Telluribacter humicola]|uniref:class I SAM-dependent methyltransferase n=1 Tax=Telluribacter humicola TaxID=1720261 RepID=UPI001A95D2D4|nr:class I SAM-dependent methyltransferase [Telluribacter humicola]